MDKGKGGSSGGDDKGFIEVKYNKLSGNNRGNKNIRPFSMKPKTQHRPKVKQSTKGASHMMSPFVETGNKAFMDGVQEKGQKSTPLIEKINAFGKQLLEGTYVLVDDDGKPTKNVDYSGNQGSEEEIKFVDKEMTSNISFGDCYGYDDYDEDPYDDDMYDGQDLTEEIQTICDKLDIRVQGRKK
nr:hypothetical protein [Tanacetum cinerariifolium]